jgi:hypothetical protein
METNRPVDKIEEVSTNQIIDSIRSIRNGQIGELMKEPNLMTFLEHYYDTLLISNVKKQFLLKDLMELKNSPLDLTHYASLITYMKNLKISVAAPSNKLFFTELEIVFNKYVSKK